MKFLTAVFSGWFLCIFKPVPYMDILIYKSPDLVIGGFAGRRKGRRIIFYLK